MHPGALEVIGTRHRTGEIRPAPLDLVIVSGMAVDAPQIVALGRHVHVEVLVALLHGVLEVAVDGDVLLLALRIPAVNVVGFEHQASSAQQREAVADAIAE